MDYGDEPDLSSAPLLISPRVENPPPILNLNKSDIWKTYEEEFGSSPDVVGSGALSPGRNSDDEGDECFMRYCNQPAVHFCHVKYCFDLYKSGC